jgi:glycosyltransferase involved in cell wall biosynthesis
MKIAYIYDVIYPFVKGGAEKRFWELARRLGRKGHEVHIFGMKSWKGPANFSREGVYIHGVGRHWKLYHPSGRRNIRQSLFFALLIFPRIWQERFDVIDCNAFPYLPFFSVKLFSWLKRIPLVITWQEVWDKYWYRYLGRLLGGVGCFLERQVIKLSDNIIAHSLIMKKELIRCGAKEDKMCIIPDGVDLEIIKGVYANKDTSDILFVGRLIKDKNTDILIESVLLTKEEMHDINCLIIGEGPEKIRLIKLAESLNLKGNINFRDFLEYEEVLSYMKSSKVFVFPSSREGFGIVVAEALACGLPVITVNHPMNSAQELIRDGENGLIARLDKQDIAGKILMLLKSEDLNRFSESAKESASCYDWDRIACENEKLYNYAISKKGK